jgi:hypothetical protein
MPDLPSFVVRGERARLFPVLADTSKEGRTLSILLACIENVDEFGRALLAELDQRAGARARIETYTEVVLKEANGGQAFRPDGLIVLTVGSKQWSALVEAKVGTADLTVEQVESYLDVAKMNGVDALITISNQFAPLPSQHPLTVSAVSRRKADLFHWSWMSILTVADLLLSNEAVADGDQRVILNEMVRFLSHPSAGVKGFEQMPACWTDLVASIQAGGTISQSAPETHELMEAWYQEARDLSLILSRQVGREVRIRVPRAHEADANLRRKADMQTLAEDKSIAAVLAVPDAAAPIEVCANLLTRTVAVSMKIAAPGDKQSTKGRLGWIIRQLQKTDPNGIFVRLNWPGRGGSSQHALAGLRDGTVSPADDRPDSVVSSFEILLVRDLGARFAQRRNFVADVQRALPDFYEQVGQNLKAWQPPAPPLPEDKAQPSDVAPEALRQQADETALARDE